MVIVTRSPGVTSVVVPERSMVPLELSTLSMLSVRSPIGAVSVPVPESETVLPLRSVAEAFTVNVPSTRVDTSTPETA